MKKNKSRKDSKIINSIDIWETFSINYLLMAKLGALEMIHGKHDIELEMGYIPIFTKKILYVPVLYNLKHGIEIFIKTLKYTLSKQLNKSDEKHDIKNLFEILKKEIKSNPNIIKSIKDKAEKSNSDSNINDKERADLNFASMDVDNLQKYVNEVEKKILKYYQCSFINSKLEGAFLLNDSNNILFRYPKGKVEINIDYDTVTSKLNRSDAEEVLKDINFLVDRFNQLQFFFKIYKRSVIQKNN